MTTDEYIKNKQVYLDNMKNMSKEEKLEYLKTCKFIIDMIDRWDEKDTMCWKIVCELIKEIEGSDNVE